MNNSTDFLQSIIETFKWYYLAHNPQFRDEYKNIPGVEEIGSPMEKFWAQLDLLENSKKLSLFLNKIVLMLSKVTAIILQWTWFIMNHEYLFEIILVLLILYLITKISKNILPPIMFLLNLINNLFRGQRRGRYRD